MKYSLLLCLASVIYAPVAVGQTAAAAYDDTEAYAVYSAFLESMDAKQLVIQIETQDFPMPPGQNVNCLTKLPKGEENVYTPIIVDYRKVNEKAWLLQRKFPEMAPYELVSRTVFEGSFAKNGVLLGWENFYMTYPGSNGFTKLSAVGFSPDKTLAIVFVRNQCGGTCGAGAYHVLQKKEGRWSQTKTKLSWCYWRAFPGPGGTERRGQIEK